jgi:hypothetical protein
MQGLLHPQGFFKHFHACLQISTLRGCICQFVQSGCNARMATVSVKGPLHLKGLLQAFYAFLEIPGLFTQLSP